MAVTFILVKDVGLYKLACLVVHSLRPSRSLQQTPLVMSNTARCSSKKRRINDSDIAILLSESNVLVDRGLVDQILAPTLSSTNWQADSQIDISQAA